MVALTAAMLTGVPVDAVPREDLRRTLEAQYAVVRESPHDPAVHNDLANLLVLAGRNDEAEVSYRRAIDLSPQAHEPRFNIALLLQQTGRAEEARAAFEELVASYPTDAWSYYQLGVLFEDQGQRPNAIENYARAFALDASLTFARNNPHIIDNKLATEALLLSARFSNPPGAMVPRRYHDRKRLQSTLLELGDEASDGYDDESPPEEVMLPTEIRPAGTAEGSIGEMAEGDVEQSRAPVQRVIGNEDLEPGIATGQVQSGGSIGRRTTASRRDAASSRINAGAVTRGSASGRASEEDEGRSPDSSTALGGGRPFQPGRTSTGRLELELLPPVPKEQYASRRSDAGSGN